MPTQRLYYTDSYTTAFDAELIEVTTYNGLPAVILDRTCFYPTSGGQPHDMGSLNGSPVVDVALRETDGAVLHILEEAPDGPRISGQIDWPRRFDHMRHHTGQHILSQAFVKLARAETVGFHLSPDSVTIDLNKPDISPAVIDAAEDLANQIVAENRPVRAYFPSDEEFVTLRLRKVPDVEGQLRVVSIEGFDLNACGGTHVARTGEIGMIKVLRADRRGDAVRIEFRCGTRALLDYRGKHALLSQLAVELTTGYDQIPAALVKLREENKTLRRELRALQAVVLEREAEMLWQTADRMADYALIIRAFEDRDVAEIRQLVQHLIAHPATVALCGITGEKAQIIAARSDDLPQDMVTALKQGLAVWGVERGGGRPSFAQGGGAAASLALVQAALETAAEAVRSAEHRG
jgi:alanyl-tRNA synthetase